MAKGLEASLSLIDYRKSSAIKSGEIWFSPKELSQALGRYCRPLLLDGQNEFHPFGIHGSSTFVAFRGRFFVVLTQHQTKNNELKTIGFPSDKEHYFAMGGRFFFSHNFASSSEDYVDELIFVDMQEHVENGSLSPTAFYPLSARSQMIEGDEIVFGAAYGYPHDVQRFDSDETGENDFRLEHVAFVTREALVRYGGAGLDDTICYWHPEKPFPYALKGMSGGPVFAVVSTDEEGFVAKLAGVTIMGTAKRINTVKIDSIRRYLTRIIDGHISPRNEQDAS